MEQKQIACGDQLPPLCANYPWLVAQNLDGTGDQIFYTIHDQPCHYQCQIPKLLGRLIRGHSHGWVILSNKNMWSLWKPVTSEIINLPPLILNNSKSVGQCCLSSSPDDLTSVLLLTITGERAFVFCQLGRKRDMLRWTRRPYNRQLKRIIGHNHGFLECPTSYNGKVYALCNNGGFVIQVDIIVKDGEVLLELLLFGRRPYTHAKRIFALISLLKGSCTELFYIKVAFTEDEVTKKAFSNVYLYKWVTPIIGWQEMTNIKDAMFFVDLTRDYSVSYNQAVASELGGYIHIRDEMGKMMYSYDVEDKTFSISSMAYPTSHVSMWECRLEGDHDQLTLGFEKGEDKDVVRSVTYDEVELNGSHLLNLPFHLLEMIMGHCIGVEYMYFRATCKRCRLAAPSIQWSNKTALRRLHNYSLVSPWLMVVDTSEGLLNFTDLVCGDRYFIERPLDLIDRDIILCSRFGWSIHGSECRMLFFNPFTRDIRKLPLVDPQDGLDSLCFSAPPTSPDCVVVGFRVRGKDAHVFIHFVAREQTWHTIRLDFVKAIPRRFCFPTLCGQDLYALTDKGELYVFKNLFKLQGIRFKKVADAKGCEGDSFLVKRDQQLLLVIVGECVEVFELNDYTNNWDRIECLRRYMIYIGATTCLCVEAKALEMQNKIFFPRLHSRKGKIVFYSLETCRYHRFNGKNVEEIVGVGRKHIYPQAWIEPTWS